MKIVIGADEGTRFLPYQTYRKSPRRDGPFYVLICGGTLVSAISRAEIADHLRRAKACGLTVVISKERR